jgi:hypothetical protein
MPPREPFSLFKWDEQRAARAVIGPKQTIMITKPPTDEHCSLDQNALQMVQNTLGLRYFMGDIRYKDAFAPGRERITQFDREFVVFKVGPNLSFDGITPNVGLDNCTDDDCQELPDDPGRNSAPLWLLR